MSTSLTLPIAVLGNLPGSGGSHGLGCLIVDHVQVLIGEETFVARHEPREAVNDR
jgi:hypothetical protein